MFNEIGPVSNGKPSPVDNSENQVDEKDVNEKPIEDIFNASMKTDSSNKENHVDEKTGNFDQLHKLMGIPPVLPQLSSIHNNDKKEGSICETDKDSDRDSTTFIENRDDPAGDINQVDEELSIEPQDEDEDIHEKETLCEGCMKELAVHHLIINRNIVKLCKACHENP